LTQDLFEDHSDPNRTPTVITPGAMLLPGFTLAVADQLCGHIEQVIAQAPLRHLTTPGGHKMSVAMTNCGAMGWVSDGYGYRYDSRDPLSGELWPAIPAAFKEIASAAAAEAGYKNFRPQACLINEYQVGAKMTLHQDKDERNQTAPIVSLSFGLPATFQFGGLERENACQKFHLEHGDAVVWGGPARFCFHGILPLAQGEHRLLGAKRWNITFRQLG